jgi:hypothetical protein
MTTALMFCREVVINGRISNDKKQYSYATAFTWNGAKYTVYSGLNRGSDKLTVIKDTKQ